MRRPLVLAALLIFTPGFGASGQAAPTRLGLISAIVQARRDYFEQRVIVDGCSLSAMVDSISSGIGALASDVAALVQGNDGRCLDRASLPRPAPRILSFMVVLRTGAEMADPRIPMQERERIFSVMVVVQNPNNQTAHTEQWVLQPFGEGKIGVVGVRISATRAY